MRSNNVRGSAGKAQIEKQQEHEQHVILNTLTAHTQPELTVCNCNSHKFSSILVFGFSAWTLPLTLPSMQPAHPAELSQRFATLALFKYLHDFRLLALLSFKMAATHSRTHTDVAKATKFHSLHLSVLWPIDIDCTTTRAAKGTATTRIRIGTTTATTGIATTTIAMLLLLVLLFLLLLLLQIWQAMGQQQQLRLK